MPGNYYLPKMWAESSKPIFMWSLKCIGNGLSSAGVDRKGWGNSCFVSSTFTNSSASPVAAVRLFACSRFACLSSRPHVALPRFMNLYEGVLLRFCLSVVVTRLPVQLLSHRMIFL